MKPSNNPLSTYGLVAGVVGQVGCLILLVILGTMLLGLVLDDVFGTRPAFMLVMLLVSVPLSILTIYLYTRYKAKHLQGSAIQKEEDISE